MERCAASFVGYGHSLCRQHAACREVRGDLRLWNPELCDVCSNLLTVIQDDSAPQAQRDSALSDLKAWIKGFQRNRSVYLANFRWKDLLFPQADAGIVAPESSAPSTSHPRRSSATASSFEGFPDDSTHEPISSVHLSASSGGESSGSRPRSRSKSSRPRPRRSRSPPRSSASSTRTPSPAPARSPVREASSEGESVVSHASTSGDPAGDIYIYIYIYIYGKQNSNNVNKCLFSLNQVETFSKNHTKHKIIN